MTLFEKNATHTFILGLLFILHLALFWPGILTSDSQTQYQIALTATYSDHHPALMSFVWRYLNFIYEGSGLMLFLHLGLLYLGVYHFSKSFKSTLEKGLCVLTPFFPAVLSFSGMIWKDVGFSYGYFLCCALLARASNEQKPFGFLGHTLFLSVLFYATAIKFQAQYCAPIFLGSYVFFHLKNASNSKKILSTLSVIFVFFLALFQVNKSLVPSSKENHSWQFVKLYDIAAVSVSVKKDLFPDFCHTPQFSDEKLRILFNHESVDDLVFTSEAILKVGQTPLERQALWDTWLDVITAYPLEYTQHRLSNLSYMVLGIPGFQKIDKVLCSAFSKNTRIYDFFYGFFKVLGLLLLSPLIPSVACWGYVFLGYKYKNQSFLAFPLLTISLMSCVLLSVLFFFSMAGTPRYIYVISCLGWVSHLLALQVIKTRNITG